VHSRGDFVKISTKPSKFMKIPLLNPAFWRKVMRISSVQIVLLLVFAGMSMATNLEAQILDRLVTLKVEEQEIAKALLQIEKQADIKFVFSPQVIRARQRVTLQVEQEKLGKLLDRLFRPLSIKYEVSGKYILLSDLSQTLERTQIETDAFAIPELDRTIRGKVTDEKGEPLPGVSIVLKGTQRGTTSGANGSYELSLPDDANMLTFSFVGYLTKETEIGKSNTLDIQLLIDQKSLDEVVVVGYGTQSKRNVTGSVSKISMKDTESLPNNNIGQSLRGRVAGVQFTDNGRPGQNGSILIRGPRSLTAGNNPLIVLDGIFFNGSLADVNPNDIESMEVLKDASASAIYGSRAANGVILITSKRGTSEKPTVRVNAYLGVSDWSNKMTLLTPERYVQKTIDYRTQAGLPNNPADITKYLTSTEATNYSAGKTVDPWEVVSQQGKMASYDLSVSGRTARTNYLISANWMKENGLIYNDNLTRLTLRTNIENKIADWLTIGSNATFIKRDYSGVEASTNQAYQMSPFGTIFYDDGWPREFTIDGEVFSSNPLRASILTKNEEIYNNLFANFYANVSIPSVQGLSYRINYSPNYRWSHTYNFFGQDKYLTNNTTNVYKLNRNDFDWVVENILTYDRQINKNHGLDVTLLYGRNHFGWESTQANASQLSSDVLGWNNLGLGGVLTNTSNAEAADGLSSMLRLNYRMKDKYLFTFTVRRDGSSVFAANNKYATFPSMALAWIASDEGFLKKQTWLDLLKLRISYGAVGNQAISPYQSLNLSSTNRYVFGDGGTSSIGVFPSNMSNTNLKWETTYTSNLAMDFELFNKRIGGTVEVYNMDTRDLIVSRSIPLMTGYTSVLTNLGATNNKGFELSLNTMNFRRDKFEWTSNFVFSYNRNRIVHLYRSDSNKDGKEDDDLGNRWFIGQPVSIAYDYMNTGIYQTGEDIPAGSKPGYVRFEDINKDGKIDASNDRTILGQMNQPKFRWGITNSVKYGQFSFSVFVNAMQGWITQFDKLDYSGINSISSNFPFRAANMLDTGWWTEGDPSKTRPSLVYPNSLGHNWYVSRNFIRIQDVSFSYDLPKQILSKLKMQSSRIFLSGKNLHTFTKFPGMDPEIGYSSTFFPLSRTITAGLNIGF
jgi:TonB-linked SusC/RagA family outer membrane protein